MKKTTYAFAAAAIALAVAFSAPMAQAETARFDRAAYEMVQAQKLDGIVVVRKDGCPVCAKQEPALQEALASMPEFKMLKVIYSNFEKDQDVNKQLGVTKQSTIIVLKDGQEVSRSTGITDVMALKAELAKAL